MTTERCPSCAKNGNDTSGNNLVTHKDGSKHCHACGYHQDKYTRGLELIPGKVADLSKRGITRDVCEKYGVRQTDFSGYINKSYPQVTNEPIIIFPFTREGKTVYQKIRSLSVKDMMGVRGEIKNKGLWGKERFHPSKKWPLIINEGEIDSMSSYQMTGCPAVSLPDGAGSASKAILEDMEWLSQWKEVLLCFDNDEPGKLAVEKCIGLFEPGTVRNVTLPLKDANDMLKEGRTEEFKKAIWNAERIRPSTIVYAKDIREAILTPPEFGSPWPWPTMTKITYGRRKGETYLLAGPTGSGKTEITKEIVYQFLEEGQKVGVFQYEQQPESTMQRYIGSRLNQRLHLPGCDGWNNKEAIEQMLDKYEDNVVLLNQKAGIVSIESLLITIRWLYKADKIEFFVIDNLKAMATNPYIDDKRVGMIEYITYCMGRFFSLARELMITIFVVNHLADDKMAKQMYVSTSPKNADEYLDRSADDMQKFINRPGTTWESGRMPTMENIFGGGTIRDLTDYVMVVSRNQESEDYDEHRKITLKFLKTRLDPQHKNNLMYLYYDYQTGRLTEENRND